MISCSIFRIFYTYISCNITKINKNDPSIQFIIYAISLNKTLSEVNTLPHLTWSTYPWRKKHFPRNHSISGNLPSRVGAVDVENSTIVSKSSNFPSGMNPRPVRDRKQPRGLSCTWCTPSRKSRRTKNTYKTFAWLQIDRSFERLLRGKKTRRKNETVTYKVAGVARLQKGKVSANYVDDNGQAAK